MANSENIIEAEGYANIDLNMLDREAMIALIQTLSIKVHDLVEESPEVVIAEANRKYLETAPKFVIEVDRGHTGYKGRYMTLDDGLSVLKDYHESFPTGKLVVTITPINQK